jgi:hypothetical protein
VIIEGTCNKKLFVAIDDMIMQHIKFIAIMHIATKINGCLLFYRNEGNLNSSFKIMFTVCTSHIITDTFFNLNSLSTKVTNNDQNSA